jgi:hypothetical protein
MSAVSQRRQPSYLRLVSSTMSPVARPTNKPRQRPSYLQLVPAATSPAIPAPAPALVAARAAAPQEVAAERRWQLEWDRRNVQD